MTLSKCRRLLPSVVRSSLLAAAMLLVTGVAAAASAHPAVIKERYSDYRITITWHLHLLRYERTAD